MHDLAAHVLQRNPVVPGIPSSLHTKQFARKTNTNPKTGVADPHLFIMKIRIRIHLFTLMRIRILLLLTKVMRICDQHWSTDRPGFASKSPLLSVHDLPRLHCERPRPSYRLHFEPIKLLNFDCNAVWIRIQLTKIMRIHTDPDPQPCQKIVIYCIFSITRRQKLFWGVDT